MATFTVTQIEVLQNEFEADTAEEALRAFLDIATDMGEVQPTIYVKEGSTYGEDWFNLAEDLAVSSPYSVEECPEHGTHYRLDGECPEPHEEDS